jgi:uncharacterized membrane protein YkvA (DUF1232 family)
MRDPKVSKWQKGFLIALMIYVISPLDLIPEPIFGVGIIDDFIMAAYIWSHFLPEMSRYKKQPPKDPIIIDYEIKDED